MLDVQGACNLIALLLAESRVIDQIPIYKRQAH
jgi:hypothetical protein